ncbi:MAG: FecR domain-containing protein [Candidatus Omnitrophota bacterium]
MSIKKIVLLSGLFVFFAVFFMAGTLLAETVKVKDCAGDVQVFYPGKEDALSCFPGLIVKEGTRLKTAEKSYAMIVSGENEKNMVKIKEKTDVIIKFDGDDKIELIDGEIFTILRGLKKGETFNVRTPCAVCGARGTAWVTRTDDKITRVSVFESVVSVDGIRKDGSVMAMEEQVEEGFEITVKKYSAPGMKKAISPARLEEIWKEPGIEKFLEDKGEEFLEAETPADGLRGENEEAAGRAPGEPVKETIITEEQVAQAEKRTDMLEKKVDRLLDRMEYRVPEAPVVSPAGRGDDDKRRSRD